MQEFYIRKNEETDARGPFSLEQLASLVEAGQVDQDTYYYDVTSEQWMTIGANEDLRGELFPEKRKLRLKPKEAVPTVNTAPTAEAAKHLSVNQMLAAAEGKTEETKRRRDPSVSRAFAANVGLKVGTFVCLLTGALFLYAENVPLFAGDFMTLLTRPLAWFGLIDIFLAVALFLSVVEVYPFVRFRAMCGLGFLGTLFLLQGDPLLAGAAAAASLGLFLATLSAQLWLAILAGAVGLAGVAGIAVRLVAGG